MKKQTPNIIIIGAGLTGLTSAYLLKQLGYSATVLEARERLGGRIHTKYIHGGSIELGATWLGKKHVHLTQLLQELGLETFEQFAGETAIYQPSLDTPAQLVRLPHNPDPSLRIKGGTSALIQKLASELDEDLILLGQVVQSIQFEENSFKIETSDQSFEADLVITTLPPKLLTNTIQFNPKLPDALLDIAEQTHTWMGESIKSGLFFQAPFWKTNGTSGTIFSNAGPMTEMYDHTNFENTTHALKGFMHPSYQEVDAQERKNQILAQLRSYYGTIVDDYLSYEECSWSEEAFTFFPYQNSILPHQNNGHAVFRQELFDNRLIIAGSETAKSFPGYMDGAVQSAHRAVEQVQQQYDHQPKV